MRRLGAGGMGAVYLGQHEHTGEYAAVKLIRPEYGADPEHRMRLRHEVAAARRVPRFCTAPVLAADLDAEPPWVATEYIDGPRLDTALLSQPRLTGAALESLAVGVAVALRAIHEHGVIHRDLKPSNILLSPLGPRVIDFGIARLAEAETRLTRTGAAIGTPAYMAPEQLRGEPMTAAVDVFAWASLVTYAATGRPPFGTGEPALYGILHHEPDLGDLAEPLRGLLLAALGKDPARRPTAADLVDRLAGAAPAVARQVLAVAAAPVAPIITDAPPPVRRRRWAAAAAAAVLGAAAVIVAVGVPRWLSTATPDDPSPTAATTAASQAIARPVEPAPPAAPPPFGSQLGEPISGLAGTVHSVAFGELDGAPIAVIGSSSAPHGSVAIRDLTTGRAIGGPLASTANDLRSVAFGELEGVPIALSGNSHLLDQHLDDDVWLATQGSVPIWDLTTQQQLGELSTDHTGAVHSIAIGELDGAPIAVTAGHGTTTAEVWDLTTRQRIGDPLPGHPEDGDVAYSVAIGELDGAPVAVAAISERPPDRWVLRIWDLTTRRPVRSPITGHTSDIRAVATGELDGTPIAVSGSDDQTLRVWDLTTGEPIGDPLTGHDGPVNAVATGALDGTPIAVSGSDDQTLQVWDLTTGEPIGDPLTGHDGPVFAVAVGELDGIPVALSGSGRQPGDGSRSADETVRVWSLAR